MLGCGVSRVAPDPDVDEGILERDALLLAPDELVEKLAVGSGCASSLRPRVWPLLLGLVPRSASEAAREAAAAENADEYRRLCALGESGVEQSHVRVIDADVPRTDEVRQGLLQPEDLAVLRSMLLAHCIAVPRWGYYQGMCDLAAVTLGIAAGRDPALAFWLLRGVLGASESNWAHADLAGVWRQARTVDEVLHVVDPKLSRRIRSLEGRPPPVAHGAAKGSVPLAFLFGALFLNLKREFADAEQACRCWEVCWAHGGHLNLLVVAAYVRTRRRTVLHKSTRSVAELHQIYGGRAEPPVRLLAAPLLRCARAWSARAAVRRALARKMDEGVGELEGPQSG
jgi:hypothetical protein